jgi:hypothetical protein
MTRKMSGTVPIKGENASDQIERLLVLVLFIMTSPLHGPPAGQRERPPLLTATNGPATELTGEESERGPVLPRLWPSAVGADLP